MSAPRFHALISALFFVLPGATFASDIGGTSIAPKGVRAFVYQYVQANVPSSFGNTGIEKDFRINETFGESVIRAIPNASGAYDQLKAVSPDLAGSINLGTVDVSPDINIKAHVFGLAWGLNDWLMIAGGFPIMNGSVDVQGGYADTGAVRGTITGLRQISDPNVASKASAFAQALEQSVAPILRGEILQGVVVNEFHYKPVGDWTGSGMGDLTLFLQARAVNWETYKNGYKFGFDLPTGRRDDPDNLVDIPFGQGYMDTFAEVLNDFVVFDEYLTLSANLRLQQNWSTTKTFRLAPSTTFPLSSDKEDISYKPGNVWASTLEANSRVFRSVLFTLGYTTKRKDNDSIRGVRTDYDYGILEHGTNSVTNTVKAQVAYSTVDAYLRGKFPVPGKLGVSMSRVTSGVNTERVNLYSLDFQMYF